MNTLSAKDGNDIGSSGNLVRIALMATGEALEVCGHGPMLNERYLHHFISHELQNSAGVQCLNGKPLVHPEWPTWKQSTGIRCGQYVGFKNERGKKEYRPETLSKGGAGFIDLALGDYLNPSVAIEVTLKCGWSHEEIVYDLVKLLDRRNNTFLAVISCNIVRRKKGLPMLGAKEKFRRRINEAYINATARLGDMLCADGRRRFFVVTEVAENERRHWWFNTTSCEFSEEASLCDVLQP